MNWKKCEDISFAVPLRLKIGDASPSSPPIDAHAV